MTSQFNCTFCGYPVDPKFDSTLEMVSGWVSNGRVFKQTERTWRFAHKACVETAWAKPNSSDNQIAMF